jgi:hypothetical protein
VNEENEDEDLHAKYPIPRSWTLMSWSLTGALVLAAMVLAWAMEWRLAALGVFVLAFPPITIRIVAWAALKVVGKPDGWPDRPTE